MASVQRLYGLPPIVTTMDSYVGSYLPIHPIGLKTPRETGLGIQEMVAMFMKSKIAMLHNDSIKDVNNIPAMTQHEEDELLSRITPPSDWFIEAWRGLFKIEFCLDSGDASNKSETKYSIKYATERVPATEVVAISYDWREKPDEKDTFEFGQGIRQRVHCCARTIRPDFAYGALTALYSRRRPRDYIKAVRAPLGDEFDTSLTDEQYDSLRLVKVKPHGEVWCLGITSETKALRIVRSRRRLLL